MNILTISPSCFPGVTAVFRNMEKTIGSKHIPLENLEGRYEFSFEPYDLVILGAYHVGYELLLPKIPCKKSILWTSSILQMEFTPDYIEFKIFNNLLLKNDIDYLFIGDEHLFDIYKNHPKIKYFPYPLYITEPFDKEVNKEKKQWGLFTVTNYRKNLLNQLLAFVSTKDKDIELVTNISLIGHEKIKMVGWLDEQKYKEAMQKLDYSLAVFPSESFCYSFAETMINSIPTLCSRRIAQNFRLPKRLMNYLCVNDCDNATKIKHKIENMNKLNDISKQRLRDECRTHMIRVAEEHNTKLKEMLETILYI